MNYFKEIQKFQRGVLNITILKLVQKDKAEYKKKKLTTLL